MIKGCKDRLIDRENKLLFQSEFTFIPIIDLFMRISILIKSIFLFALSTSLMSWGFFSHKKINRIAVFTLPSEMIPFYKTNIQLLSESAVNPDKRRYIIKEEASRHFIDLDVYGDSALFILPKYWSEAVKLIGEDSLQKHGIVPWHVERVQHNLTNAFIENDPERILKYSSDLGHYIADANVPLHTTQNYNGQLTGQHGIHGFWESRIPELFFDYFELFTGKSTYIPNTQLAIWDAIQQAHASLDSVFNVEKSLSESFPPDKKYSFEEKGNSTVRVYSYEFSKYYYEGMDEMIEKQMRKSIKMTGDFWYTAWVNAGQPDLSNIINVDISINEENGKILEKLIFRNHESGENINPKSSSPIE